MSDDEAGSAESADHADDEIGEVMGRFLEDLETADDLEPLVRQYTAAHPHLEVHFLEHAAMQRMLRSSRDEDDEEKDGLAGLDRIPDFRIVRWIASGGMGVVFEAVQVSLARRVALKVRHGRAAADLRARFVREQQTLARLHHTHIVPIHVSDEAEGLQYFAMAYIEGAALHHVAQAARSHLRGSAEPLPPLRELVRRLRTQPGEAAAEEPARPCSLPLEYFESVAATLADAAEALDFAHRADVVHRDVKPSNLMLDEAGHCWIIDFGLAHCVGGAEDGGADPSAPSSPSAQLAAMTLGPVGTAEYMAPEQHRRAYDGAPADARSDVWGLGATLYEMLTLRRPFQGDRYEEVKRQVLHNEPAPARSLVRNAPADLVEICRKAMRKDMADRYATAGELAADLRRWLRGEPTTARPARFARTVWMAACRNPGWAFALVAALLALSASAVSVLVHQRGETRQAELRAEAAEERQREQLRKTQLQSRESLMHQVQNLQLARLANGWSDAEWELIRQAADLQRDDRLRDLAASTLLGLDARLAKRFALPASSVAFDAAGQRLLLGGQDAGGAAPARPALLWGGAGSEQESSSTLPGQGPVAFDEAGTPLQLAHDATRRAVVLWDVAKNRPVREFPLPEAADDKQAPLLALSAKAAHVAVSRGGRTLLWDVASGEVVAKFGHPSDAVAFSASGDLVALADPQRRRLVVWSLGQRKTVAELHAGNLPTRSLAFGRTARRPDTPQPPRLAECLASGDAGGTITVWNLEARMPATICRGSPREVLALAFSPDGTLLASAGREEGQLWDVASGRPRLKLSDPKGMDYMTGLAFSPDGRLLAVSSEGSAAYAPGVTVWELASQRGMRRLSGLSGLIDTVVVSPDGRRLAALAQNWEVGVWDLHTGHLHAVLEAPHGAYSDNAGLAFSPDGKQLAFAASSTSAGEARLWDADTGAELHRWKLPPGLQNKLAFDGPDRLWHFQVEIRSGAALPDSSLPWRQHPRVCRVRDLKSSDPLRVAAEVADFNCHVYLAVAAQDGSHFAVEGRGGADGAQRWVKILEAATGRAVWSLDDPRTSKAGHLVLDPSGATLHLAVGDGPASRRVSVPEGQPRGEGAFMPWATTDNAAYHCITHNGREPGCFLLRAGDANPVLGLSRSAGVVAAAFNRAGDRLAWGERDGSILVADLQEMRRRLASIGLGW